MALASFPAACSPTHDESSAIAYLRVDKKGARHFLEVAWHTNSTQRYLFKATPAFAQSLQSVIQSVNQAHAQHKRWSGPGSLGKMIDMARKEGRLRELTPSQCDEFYARTHADRDADFGTHEQTFSTPISGRATNQEPENLHTDDAVATRPLPTAIRINFMADDDAYNDYQIERECCLLVLNLVSSTLPCIRRPRPRLRVLDVRGFV
jgi:tellurite resistance protein